METKQKQGKSNKLPCEKWSELIEIMNELSEEDAHIVFVTARTLHTLQGGQRKRKRKK